MEAKGGSPNADRLKGNSEFELQEAQGLSDAAPVIAQSNPVSASQKQLQRHNSHYEVVIGMPENDEVELMDPISPEDQVPVEFSGVNAWVPVGLGAPSIFAQATALFKKKKDSKPQFRQARTLHLEIILCALDCTASTSRIAMPMCRKSTCCNSPLGK